MSVLAATLGGMALGGLASGLGTGDANRRIYNAQKRLEGLKGDMREGYAGISSGLSDAYKPYTATAAQDWSAYRDAAQGFDSQAQRYADAGSFDYDLESAIQSLMDPYLAGKIEAGTKAIEGSAANAGKLQSSASAQAITRKTDDLYSTAWRDALAAAQRQQAQEYGQWSGAVSRDRAAVDQANSILGTRLSLLGDLAGQGLGATTNLAGAQAGLSQSLLSDLGNLGLQQAQLESRKGSILGNTIGGMLTGGIGGLSAWNNK